MKYQSLYKPRAFKDLKSLRETDRERIYAAVSRMEDNLLGDIKKLENFIPNYRLRVGDFRVLFEVEDDKIIVYRVVNRREAYR